MFWADTLSHPSLNYVVVAYGIIICGKTELAEPGNDCRPNPVYCLYFLVDMIATIMICICLCVYRHACLQIFTSYYIHYIPVRVNVIS